MHVYILYICRARKFFLLFTFFSVKNEAQNPLSSVFPFHNNLMTTAARFAVPRAFFALFSR